MSPRPLVASDGQMSITAYRQQGDYLKCSALGWSSDTGTPHVFTWTLDAPMFSIVHILPIIFNDPLNYRLLPPAFPTFFIPFVLLGAVLF